MGYVRQWKMGQPLTNELLFYTDTYCEGITEGSSAHQYNGIIQNWGIINDDFNVYREAEGWLAHIRNGYFDEIMKCNEEIAKLKDHQKTVRQDARTSRKVFYWIKKRILYTRAFMSITLCYMYCRDTCILYIDDPYGMHTFEHHDRELDFTIRSVKSKIFFHVQPLLRLNNRIAVDTNTNNNYPAIISLAKSWREYQ